MVFNQVLNNLIEYRGSDNTKTKLIVRAGRKTTEGDSHSKPPCEHVGENPLNPEGNCWKYYNCSCTKLEDCTQCDDYHGISKRKRNKRKKDEKDDSVISDEEKKLLRQFRQQERWESHYDDFSPIGGKV